MGKCDIKKQIILKIGKNDKKKFNLYTNNYCNGFEYFKF